MCLRESPAHFRSFQAHSLAVYIPFLHGDCHWLLRIHCSVHYSAAYNRQGWRKYRVAWWLCRGCSPLGSGGTSAPVLTATHFMWPGLSSRRWVFRSPSGNGTVAHSDICIYTACMQPYFHLPMFYWSDSFYCRVSLNSSLTKHGVLSYSTI